MEGHAVVPLRPSSEHILIVRAPGAVGHTGFPNPSFSLLGGGLVGPLTARIERALVYRARSASKGVHRATPLALDCPFQRLL